MNEHAVVFNARTGHNHDGVNSAPIELSAGQVTLDSLSAELLEYLENFLGGGVNNPGGTGQLLANVPDLVFETDGLDPGESVTGTVPWVSDAVVKYLSIGMTESTLCDITFYHTAEFTNEQREFKARDCTANFLWEGVWAHSDNTGSNNVYYKIENTGPVTSSFSVTLKSSTMVATSDSVGGGFDGNPPTELLEAMSSLFQIAVLSFTAAGGSDGQIDDIMTHWTGGTLEELDIETMSWQLFIRIMGVITHFIGIANLVKDSSHYVGGYQAIELDVDGNGSATLDVPADNIDVGSLTILATQAIIPEDSASHYFITLDDGSDRTFGFPIDTRSGKGGGNTDFVANVSGGPDIPVLVSAPGATSGTIYVSLGFRVIPTVSELIYWPVIG